MKVLDDETVDKDGEQQTRDIVHYVGKSRVKF